jgi:type II secretory ATPase GspE/PulE/Tfp pilus assembly ATPase PilB-like protein
MDKGQKNGMDRPTTANFDNNKIVDELVSGKIAVVDLLNQIVEAGLQQRASDIHIEPLEAKVVVRYRIDGILHEVMFLDKSIEDNLITRIKVASKLRTDEHYAPQDGRITFNVSEGHLDTRISILPTTLGEKVVIRLLTQHGRSYSLEDLGLSGDDLAKVKRSYLKPYGMILATGPTGSGKTTTLYSVLKILNSREKNITTVEDPVEYNIEGVNHIQINPKANLTFANGLRSILRQDPDIIMVGEIRDTETAKIAVNAALTGHLMLSTLHTNDAITTIPRLIDMGVEPFLIASTLNVVVAQRLARKLCDNCKKPYQIKGMEIEELTESRPDIAKLITNSSAIIYKEFGCSLCSGTGFKGRIGLYEVLQMNEVLRELITSNASVDEIFRAARKNGLKLIVEDGITKLMGGFISITELVRVTALKE